jgi:protein SCO1/2
MYHRKGLSIMSADSGAASPRSRRNFWLTGPPMTSLKRILPFFIFVAGFLALGAAAVVFIFPHARSAGGATIGGSFALEAPDGHVVTDKDMAGRPYLVFFGYTHCPDICPATLSDMTAVYKELGPDAAKVNALFISIDPERDTPATMKDYLSSFDPHITGLSGSPDQTKAIETAFRVYAKKVPDKDGSYTMDHIAITYLMDKSGQFVGAFNFDQPAKDAAASLRQYF